MIWAVSLLSMDLITHALTAEYNSYHSEFDSIQYLEMRPSLIQCSTCMNLYLDASPKAISGRTSYRRVRLEFLRYPQLIRQLFNEGRFGPPFGFTQTSTWSWIDHIGFGSTTYYLRPIETRFRFGSASSA